MMTMTYLALVIIAKASELLGHNGVHMALVRHRPLLLILVLRRNLWQNSRSVDFDRFNQLRATHLRCRLIVLV